MAGNYDKRALAAHKKYGGKLEVRSRMKIKNRDDLSLAYTPGVGAVSRHIAAHKEAARTHTWKGRTVAVISDGSAVLGLGNLGPEAALPVMEGKCVLLKAFADVDAVPIVLATQDVHEIVAAITAIAPTYGGINLEDISAPRCFIVEERLKKALPIPVFHDDQHGTAIVVLAALSNALRVVGKKMSEVRVVIHGAGAAATAIYHILVRAGTDARKIIVVDSRGIISRARDDLRDHKIAIARESNGEGREGTFADALIDADVCIGVSVGGALHSEWVAHMADDPIIFALANPNPEITLAEVQKTKVAVFGAGRSDYPNQINNVLAFPGIFRGALDAGATAITEEMKLAAAEALARLVPREKLSHKRIIPDPFDKRVAPAVARAVARAWRMHL